MIIEHEYRKKRNDQKQHCLTFFFFFFGLPFLDRKPNSEQPVAISNFSFQKLAHMHQIENDVCH